MRTAIAAGLAAFLLRVVLLFALPRVPVVSDAALYERVARQLAGLDPGPPAGGFYRGFGYPLFLSGLYAVRPTYLGVRIAQALLWAVAVALVVAIAERQFGRRIAVVAGVIALIQVVSLPHFLFLLTENLLVVELIGATAVLVFLRRSRPQVAAVAYGALLGSVALTHLGWELYPLFGLPLLWSRRLLAFGAVSCALVIAGTLVPLHALNPGQPWRTGKGNSGYGGGSAWTFYVGTRVDTGGRPTAMDYAAAEARLHSDSYYWRKGVENITDAPGRSILLWFEKQWRLWGTAEREPSSGSHALDRALANVGKFVNSLAFALAAAGLGVLVLRRVWQRAMLLGMPAVYAVLVFPTFTTPEARYAFVPGLLLAVPAALLLTRFHRLVRGPGRLAHDLEAPASNPAVSNPRAP